MNTSSRQNTRSWGSFLDDDRQTAVARVEHEWAQYITELEHRSLDAGRSAEKHIRLFRQRENERLETLRELEAKIATASAQVDEREAALRGRLGTLQHKTQQKEQRLADLDRAIRDREGVLAGVSRDVSANTEEITHAQKRIQTLAAEERQAKERLILLQTRGDMQLREQEAKFKAINYRSNVIVAEAAEKVRLLHEIEKELSLKVDSLEAQLQAITDTTRPPSLSSSLLPAAFERDTRRVERSAPPVVPHAYSQKGNRALHVSTSTREVTTRQTRQPATAQHQQEEQQQQRISNMELNELSVMLCRLEEEFRDSLVEVTAGELTRVAAACRDRDEEVKVSRDSLTRSISSSEVFEF